MMWRPWFPLQSFSPHLSQPWVCEFRPGEGWSIFGSGLHLLSSFLFTALTCISGWVTELSFGSVPQLMQGRPLQNCVCFQCSCVWGPEGYDHLVLVFSLDPYTSRFLQIFQIFHQYYALLALEPNFVILHWAILFLNCSLLLFCSLSQSHELLLISTSGALSLSKMLF